jgi:hypothetical protein
MGVMWNEHGWKKQPLPINENPDDVWNETAQTVLKEIRSETGIPDWLPKYLNGRDDFERRVMALIGRHGRPFSQADMKRKLSLALAVFALAVIARALIDFVVPGRLPLPR